MRSNIVVPLYLLLMFNVFYFFVMDAQFSNCSYISIDSSSNGLVSTLQEVDTLMQDDDSLVHHFLTYVNTGLPIAIKQEVLNVLYEADAFVLSDFAPIDDQKRAVLMDQIEALITEIKFGTRSSLSLPQVVGFETLFGNAASLYVAADTSATVVAGTTDRANATSVVLASDTAATFGAGTTAMRGWTINKNASTAELAFNYENTDTVGQVAVPEYTVMQLDGLNNQVEFPATSTQIVFGGDTNLYRSSVNVLKTDDNFIVGGLTSTGVVHNNASGLLSTSLLVNADVDAAAAIVDTKLATIATAGKVSNSATTATNLNTANAIVARNASGNFTANMITLAGTTTNATDISTKAYVDSVAGVGGTNLNTANATVKRDSTGTFAAQTISLVDGVVSRNISLSDSTSATVGNVTKAGTRFIHNFGTNNVFVGKNAGNFTMSGTGQNVGVGVNALAANTTGAQNTAIGYNALAVNTIGAQNTAIGYGSLEANTTGANNTAVGYWSLRLNATGTNNTAAGYYTFFNSTSGTSNTVVGYQSFIRVIGANNAGIGSNIFSQNAVDATGTNNVGIGSSACAAITTGIDNTGIGYSCVLRTTTSNQNTGMGSLALNGNTAGSQNTAVGYLALGQSSTSSFSTAIGNQALRNTSIGGENTAIGQNAMQNNKFSSFNVVLGQNSLSVTEFNVGYNTAVGQNSLAASVNSNYVTALGVSAGSALNTGDNNVFIGYNSAPSTTFGANNIYIDGNSLNPADESNTIRIGNTQTACYVMGISGQTAASGVTLRVNSSGKLGTVTSSRRFKHDIQPMEDASDGLYSLNPVTFVYNNDETESIQYGLIAEEVDEVFPALVVREDDGTVWTVRYEVLPALLLNEIKKQNSRLKDHDKDVINLLCLVESQFAIIALLKEAGKTVRCKLNALRKDC